MTEFSSLGELTLWTVFIVATYKWVNNNYLRLYACQFSLHQFSHLLRKFDWYRICFCFVLCHLAWTIFTISNCSSTGDHWLENCVYKKSHYSHQSWWDRDLPGEWCGWRGSCSIFCLFRLQFDMSISFEEHPDVSSAVCFETYCGWWQAASYPSYQTNKPFTVRSAKMPCLFSCPKCSRRTFTIIKLIQHIGLIHAHEANFSITCGLNDCQRSFTKYESFRCHVYRKHTNTVLQQTITTTTDPLPLLDEVEEECTTDVAFSAPPNMNELLQQFRENLLFFSD